MNWIKMNQMKKNLLFLDFFVDLFFVNFMRTEYGKFDQISQNSKKIFAHAKIDPNEVFVYLWYLFQGFNLVLVL